MGIDSNAFVAGMSALGAGMAMIAGLGPGIGEGYTCLLYTSLQNRDTKREGNYGKQCGKRDDARGK